MGQNRTAYMIYGAIALSMTVYFLVAEPSKAGAQSGSAGTGTEHAAAGGSSAGDTAGSGSAGDEGASLFGSSFFLSGQPTKGATAKRRGSGGEPDILDPADKQNPVNPQTGRRYANSVMRQFDGLRKRFPNNSIIPRKKTPEELAQEKAERKRMFALQSMVAQGRGTPDEIRQYYSMRTKPVKDRIELLNFVVEKYADRMSDKVKNQYKKILDMNKRTLKNYETMQSKAIEKSQASGE